MCEVRCSTSARSKSPQASRLSAVGLEFCLNANMFTFSLCTLATCAIASALFRAAALVVHPVKMDEASLYLLFFCALLFAFSVNGTECCLTVRAVELFILFCVLVLACAGCLASPVSGDRVPCPDAQRNF